MNKLSDLLVFRGALKSNVTTAQHPTAAYDTPSSMIEAPDWHLFKRMEIADAHFNQPKIKNFPALHHVHLSHRPFICLNNEQMTEAHIIDAIQQLASTGGELRLAEGRCTIRQSLYLPSNVQISGVHGRTELVFMDIAYGFIIQGTVSNPICCVGLNNLRLQHEGHHIFCATVLMTHAEKMNIEQVSIHSPRGIGFLLSDHVYESTFLDCHVKYAGSFGFMLIRDVQETILKNCSAEYCQQSGVFLSDLKLPADIDPLNFSAQNDYTNNVIGNFAAFESHDPSPYRTDIIACVFRHNRKMGITTDGVGYLSVQNSVIAHNDCEGITIDNGSWGCRIIANHIHDNGWRGHQQEIELGIDFVHAMGLMPDGSSKAKLPGISLDNAAFTHIESNHIECNWGDGVKMVRAVYASTLAHNLIGNNNRGVNDKFHYFGVLIGVAERQHPHQDDFPSCNNRVIDNDILGQHFAGIHLMSGVAGNIIKHNHISGATFTAIEDHVLSGNLIKPLPTH